MPSVSRAQYRYVRMMATRGAKWAIRWAAETPRGLYKRLPERKGRKSRKRRHKR